MAVADATRMLARYIRCVLSLAQLGIQYLTTAGSSVAMGLLGLMMAMQVYEVVSRYIFGRPTGFSDEVVAYMLVVMIAVGAAYSLKSDAHIRINAVTRLLPQALEKKLWLAVDILMMAFVIILTWQAYEFAYQSYLAGRKSMYQTMTPLYIPQFIMAAGLTIFAAQYCLDLLIRLKEIRRKDSTEISNSE